MILLVQKSVMKFDFSEPQLQSSKGILIIFAFKSFKIFKEFFFVFIGLGVSLTRKNILERINVSYVWLGLFLLLIALLVYAILKYFNFRFHLSEDSFHLASGILNKDNTVIPKSKIQNVYIKQNLLQQIINVVSLKIETAGDDKSEIEISALDKPIAEALKNYLFNKPAKGIETEEITINEPDVFFKVSPKRLFLEGLSQNHLRSFAIMTSFLVGSFYQFETNIKDIELYQSANNVNFDGISSGLYFLLITIMILIVLVVSTLFSVVKTFIINFNLQLRQNEGTIEIEKGLLNKVSLSLTPRRIQNIVFKTNRLKRYLNLHSLSVKQAMVSAKQKKALTVVALEAGQLHKMIDRLIPNYIHPSKTYKPDKYYIRILFLRAFLFTLLVNIPLAFSSGLFFFLANLVIVLFAASFIIVTYRKAYYHLDKNFITIGSGFIDTTTNILESHKIQSIRIRQTFFQRRRRIASLLIYTASKQVKIQYIKEIEAKKIYDFLIFKVESENKDWM